jgi:predicted phage terminase large subunit-like protein
MGIAAEHISAVASMRRPEKAKRKVPKIKIEPQPGPQTDTLASKAQITVSGGGAGGGKTWALLIEPLRWVRLASEFNAVIFRREYPEIEAPGGMWDESQLLYRMCRARPRENKFDWTFPTGATIKFAHMAQERDRFKWKGAQINFLGFDQVESFTWDQFSYLLSRNRSTSGVPPYVRVTCNPVPEDDPTGGWLHRLLRSGGYIDRDQKTGAILAVEKMSGRVRWFINLNDEILWGNSRKELRDKHGDDIQPKSFTFIPSDIYDNKILLDQDPGYLANLQALPKIERLRLLGCDWGVRAEAGMYFQREWFPIVRAAPATGRDVRYWDRASTDETSPSAATAAHTAGVRMRMTPAGEFYIIDVVRFQGSPGKVRQRVKNVAQQDGPDVTVWLEGDPGQAGVSEAQQFVQFLATHGITNVRINTVHESKGTRALPLSAQAEAGNVMLVQAEWNHKFLMEAENFDGSKDGIWDQVDGGSGGLHVLTSPEKEWSIQ